MTASTQSEAFHIWSPRFAAFLTNEFDHHRAVVNIVCLMQHALPHPLPQLPQRQPPTAAAACHRSTSSFRVPKRIQRQAFACGRCQPDRLRQPTPCRATGNDEDDLGAAFSEELSRRSDKAAQHLEQEEVCCCSFAIRPQWQIPKPTCRSFCGSVSDSVAEGRSWKARGLWSAPCSC